MLKSIVYLKTQIFSQSRKPMHKCIRERKHFYLWICIQPGCDAYHKQSAKRVQRQKSHSFIGKQVQPVHIYFEDQQ